MVGERGAPRRSRPARGGGARTSANAGMSSARRVSKHAHRMAEGSYGRFILVGLVGPKPRPQGVGDGQTVDIPLPPVDDEVAAPVRGGVGRAHRLDMVRLSVQGAPTRVAGWVVPRRGRLRGSGRGGFG